MLSFTGRLANFEDWYDDIKEFTPKSTYFKVDTDTKQVLIARTFDKIAEEDIFFTEMNDRPNTDGLDESYLISALVKEMDEHIRSREVFFRTNLFSPKDVKSPSLVSSGANALELLQSSFRLYKGYKNILKDEDLYLVFREKTDYNEEFRCFIEDGFVKGISHYDDSNTVINGTGATSVFEFDKKEYLCILKYVESVVKETNVKDAVMDIGLTSEGMSVIELNPYGNITDKSLFAETDIYEREIEGKTEIRYWSDTHTIHHLWIKNGVVVSEETTEVYSQSEEEDTDHFDYLINILGMPSKFRINLNEKVR